MKRVLWLAFLLAFLFLALLLVILPAQAQVNVTLTPTPKVQWLDLNGDPLANGHVHAYISGTTTNQATYTDSTGAVANANPVVLDSAGRAEIWLDDSLVYTLALHDSSNALIWSVDGVSAGDLETALVVGTTAVTFTSTPTFDSSTASYFSITLTGNVTSSTISNASDGRIIYFNICQDATGGRTFTWDADVLTAPTIGSAASSCTSASFIYDGTNWRELAASSRGSSVFDTSTIGVLNKRRVVDGIKFTTVLEAHDDCPSAGCILFVPDPLTIPAMTITKPIKFVFGAGDFTVSGTILFQNVRGFIWEGAGASIASTTSGATRFIWGGNGTDPMFKLDDVGNSSKFADFEVVADAATPLAAAFYSENGAGSTIAPGGRLFENLMIQGTDGGITKGFLWVGTGAGGDNNNDTDTFRNVRVANYVTAAWSFEHGQSKAHRFYSCSFSGGSTGERGIATNQGAGTQGGSFNWYGGVGGNNSVADFDMGNTNDVILISGGNWEGSARLLQTGGPASAPWGITIQGVRWAPAGNLAANGRAIVYQAGGGLTLIGNTIGNVDSDALEVFINMPVLGMRAIAINNNFRTSLSDPFTNGGTGEWILMGNSVQQGPTVIVPDRFPSLIVNENGTDTDSRIEGDTDPNLFYVDAGNDRVGIGTSTPSSLFDVDGDSTLPIVNPLEGSTPNAPRWIFKQVDFGDMTAGATADTFTLWTLPANTMIYNVIGNVVTGWSGGSISAAVCSVGTNAGAANDLTLDDNFFAAAAVYELHDATANGGKGALLFDATDKFAPHFFVAGGVIEVQCDLTGDNHANATAGQAQIWIEVSQPFANTTTEAN